MDRKTDEAVFYQLAQRILIEHPDCRGLFFPNSLGHQVAQLLKKKVWAVWIHLIRYELLELNQPFLQKRLVRFLISQRPDVQGYQGIYLLYQHLLLIKSVSDEMNLPINSVTAENLDEHAETESAEHSGRTPVVRPVKPGSRKK